ncbi:MAG TPA: hypothetical protein VLG50_02240 [Candidatus Saccharimonadales bacterium]|nr:hypothetical protein [Candidatus Saccharimonadales bacterium]
MNKNMPKCIKFTILMLTIMQSNYIMVCESDVQLRSQKYLNTIVDAVEIRGTKNITTIVTFQDENPIITYAPASFAQSQDTTYNRYFMPNTTFADDINNVPSSLQQKKSGVEFEQSGTLIKKIVDGKKILITIAAA